MLTVGNASVPLDRILFDPAVDPNFPPLYSSVVHLFIELLGTGEVALRLPSVIAGTLSIPLMFSVGRAWAGPAAGLLAASLLAISPLHLWYSQEARPYALFMALALTTVWFAQRLLRRPDAWPLQLGLVVSAAATFYCHLLALPFLAFVALYLLGNAPAGARGRVLLLLGAVGLLMAPQLARFWGAPPPVSANAGYRFHPAHLGYTLWTFGTGYSLGPTLLELRKGLPALGRHLPLIVPVLAGLSALLLHGARYLWRTDRRGFWSLFGWLALPVGFAVLGTLISSHPYNVRYTLLSLPPFLLLLAIGAHGGRHPLWRVAGAAFLVVVSLSALVNYYVRPEYQREDNRGATAFLNAHAGQGELVIASAPYTTVVLRHYGLRADLQLRPYPDPRIAGRPEAVAAGLERLSGNRDRVWLFLSRTFHSDPQGEIERFFDRNFIRVLEHTGPGVRVLAYRRRDRAAPPP